MRLLNLNTDANPNLHPTTSLGLDTNPAPGPNPKANNLRLPRALLLPHSVPCSVHSSPNPTLTLTLFLTLALTLTLTLTS